jgi:alginate O-acetyltransferase complex protein AlgI
MLFNSLQFCAFFVIVTVAYFVLPWRMRWLMLLSASCIFYMAFIPAYIVILFTTILIDYWMGIKIADASGRRRRIYLQVSIVATCLVLFVFKYFNFFALTVRQLQGLFGADASFPIGHIILPIGLSFHTFQSLSYVIEVYRGHQKPERHFGIYALYVMFYPQLVAGPIERPQNLLHQFYEDHKFDLEDFSQGLQKIAWGFFMKMVIADRAATVVNSVYGSWAKSDGLTLLMATVMFAVQIYADFAGYSSIAIGCARVMGIHLMQNFNHPYFSRSIAEFWKRWHISLSTWFKDYVYIPLGGNRVSMPRHFVNLIITFGVSGLWHGANWTFVVWGVYNGVLLVVESLLPKNLVPHNWFGSALRRGATLGLTLIGWVFFRAPNLSVALGILRRIGMHTRFNMHSIQSVILSFRGDNTSLAVCITTLLFIALMFVGEWAAEHHWKAVPPRLIGWKYPAFATVALFQIILMFGILRASSFIYFQF